MVIVDSSNSYAFRVSLNSFMTYGDILFSYMANQWIVFFVRSDWLPKLRIASTIHLPAFFWTSSFASKFFLLEKKKNYLVLALHCFGIY